MNIPIIPPQNNFADLREDADRLIRASGNESLQYLAGIVGKLSYRCDLLEREVERLGQLKQQVLTSARESS